MAESDASESSVLVDLSDQIDVELSEEGGSICRAESVPVQPYRHEPYRLDSDEEATENDQQSGAEASRYSEESTNKKQVVKKYWEAHIIENSRPTCNNLLCCCCQRRA